MGTTCSSNPGPAAPLVTSKRFASKRLTVPVVSGGGGGSRTATPARRPSYTGPRITDAQLELPKPPGAMLPIPSSLLAPGRRAVPYEPGWLADTKRSFDEWCDTSTGLCVRAYLGAGGAGNRGRSGHKGVRHKGGEPRAA